MGFYGILAHFIESMTNFSVWVSDLYVLLLGIRFGERNIPTYEDFLLKFPLSLKV